MMENINWIAPRAETDSSSTGFQFEVNSTSAWDNELKLAAAGSVRTSIVVLASFNIVAAFATAISILWQSWKTAKRVHPTRNLRSSWFRLVQPRDVHPFILSCGIVVQGIVYSIAQAKGFNSLMVLECASISQLMLPGKSTSAGYPASTNLTLALFITPVIQLIFGLELTIRISKPSVFPARGRWNVLICLAVTGVWLLLTYLITFAVRPSNFCFAGLFWYLHEYNTGCFGVLTSVVLVLLVLCGIISFKLHSGAKMSCAERDEASRMIYYMIIGLISYTLLITFFYNTSFEDPLSKSPTTMQLAMVVSVAANLSGLLTGGLYLFLRSSKASTQYCEESGIGATKGFNADGEGYALDPSGPGPTMPRPLHLPNQLRKADSKEVLLDTAKDEGKVFGARRDILNHGLKPLRLVNTHQSQDLPTRPRPARTSSKASIKKFKKSMYSLFPKEQQPKSPQLLPTTTYTSSSAKKAPVPNSADGLLAPRPLRIPDKFTRSRGASMISTATVQIGLRLSNINDMRPSKPSMQENPNKVHNLDCPNSTVTFFPNRTNPLAIAVVDVPGEGTMYEVHDKLEKELPPVPLGEGHSPAETDQMTLSSSVYSPQKRKVGPFSHVHSGSASSRGQDSRQGSRAGPESRKGDWI
ncbi:hypothetical protein FZEAL_5444 [Fusarium zealandicum]|uniref:Uncharacterized protein n=1 Tax=Fusarium zealandicum TaxID=1053134 RepID=A0A8H4XJS4_9HYPO|nr:hypothetical protein FZEAL_5444 [Fusarium zealandicum]